ncbi:ABC transporter [Sodiomyces alkalinus F11]|uniref:ABC transporter n=1 Tax=Sodiomyces alkalinus (strain CBS 110278 / VKM F-3762 / F11) TaxID=1314773 RepID=A0A3N2Q0X2_SODAK|nr:ABC transporter [Sodiomyces alkalinus F11]ROT40409.1 ABC transporter [Sodiomyces alkalinus F11]
MNPFPQDQQTFPSMADGTADSELFAFTNSKHGALHQITWGPNLQILHRLNGSSDSSRSLSSPRPQHRSPGFVPSTDSQLASINVDYVAIAQAAIAVFLLLAVILRPICPPAPQWCSPFAKEEVEEAQDQEEEDDSDDSGPGSRRWTVRTFWIVHLAVVAIVGLAVSLTSVLLPPQDPIKLIHLIPWLIAALITAVQRPTKTPKTLLALYTNVFACHLALLEASRRALEPLDPLTVVRTILSFAALVAVLLMPMRDPNLPAKGIAHAADVPTRDCRSPEDNLSLWQFMTVSWMSPLIARGTKTQLHDEDVWQLPYEFQHSRLHMLFRDLQGTVMKRLFLANGLDLVTICHLGLLESAANLSVPLLLKRLLQSIQAGPHHTEASLLFAAAILAARLVACQSSVFTLWFSRRCYERSRGEMITTIYAKTLSRKSFGQQPPPNHPSTTTTTTAPEKASQQPATTGKILNLMRSDVYEVAQRFWDFPQLVTRPLQFVLSFALVWQLLGWPCLLGLACVTLAQALHGLVIRRLIASERLRRIATDDRLQATSQFVEGIRHLRWYDWQSKWLDRIAGTRQRELDQRIVTGLWRVAISTVNVASATLFPVATFFAYTFIAGRTLRVEVAFPALQLFTMLESSFKELPNLITVLLNASVAMDRIEQFMTEPDKDEPATDGSGQAARTPGIEFRNAWYKWPGTDVPVLRDLCLDFPPGLSVVFGKVGSGKSALLQAMLGELDHVRGDASLPNDAVGYCAQLPWLQHMSIRDNILFSAPYDPGRYARVLDACALRPDLASFKHGDLSDMGENGIGLSGGQRARVALARAVYSYSRVLLLDDPLAALDHNTAESIVQKLFRGPLVEGRTVVLVTHRVDLCLHLANRLVELEDGWARVLDSDEASREVAKFLRREEREEVAAAAAAPAASTAHDDQRPSGLDDNQEEEEEEEEKTVPDKFIEEEHRRDGGVMLSVYWTYIKAGKLRWWAALIVVFGLYRFGSLLNYWFLKAWGEAYRPTTASASAYASPSGSFVGHLFDRLPNPESDLRPWLLTYLGIALGQTLVFATSEGLLLVMVYQAAKHLFMRVIDRVSSATFRFYDVTPVGRLMNRLVSDIGMIDGGIMGPLQQVAWWGLAWLSSMVVIASVTPAFLLFSTAMTVWFVYIFTRFLPTSQSLRRLEMVSLSPLMSNFGILLDGLATIRAFKAQPHFQDRNIAVTDAFQKMDHFYWSLQAWLMYRFDALSAFSTFALTLLALYEGLSPGLTAFVLTTASQFVEATHNLCKQYGTLQMDFVSVERVIELLSLPREPQGDVTPPATWPTKEDDIVFDNVTLRYAEHLDPSLAEASFRIPGGSTCAVLGRTGSGKSTLALSLLAAVHPSRTRREGSIRVGGVRLSEVNVHAWRQRVSFVAQDPVLFPGTLRENLDPLGHFADEECAAVLRRVLGAGWELGARVDGGGRNLSQGQRQLVGIGRAVLRRSPVVVLDEATASIDKETAARVQEVLREELRTSTVVTIAHRLEAVRGADYYLRLDGGRVVEQGPAENLGCL